MLIEITEEDLKPIPDWDVPGCTNCVLGKAINRVIKGGYCAWIMSTHTQSRDEFGLKVETVQDGPNTMDFVGICVRGNVFWKPTGVLLRLPPEAVALSNTWEAAQPRASKTWLKHPDRKLEPTTFELPIPQEYLNERALSLLLGR